MAFGLQNAIAQVDGSVSWNDKNYASKTYSNLIREQYDDYRDRFLPYEQRLMSLADSTQLLDEQLGRITANNNSYYSGVGKQQDIMNQRYGLSQSADQKMNSSRNTDISRALSIAHAKNNTRIAHADMQNGILTGASSTQKTINDQLGA